MNYAQIKTLDIANGDGIRVSLFVSGCRNRCKGCFNKETWNFSYGLPFDAEAQKRILDLLSPEYISGLSVLGGEPFEPENQRELLPFLASVKNAFACKSIWVYTGCVFERDLQEGGRVFCGASKDLLSMVDVLVDGPFIEERKDISLRFRGSGNQRIIDIKQTLAKGKIVLYDFCDSPENSAKNAFS